MAPLPRLRLLVVDDDQALRRTLARILAPLFDVVQADDGAAAIALLENQSFDGLLTDLEMPAVGGDGIVRWLEKNSPAMASRVVVMTGGAKRPDQAAWLRDYDCSRVVHKPYTREQVLAVLERVLPKFER